MERNCHKQIYATRNTKESFWGWCESILDRNSNPHEDIKSTNKGTYLSENKRLLIYFLFITHFLITRKLKWYTREYLFNMKESGNGEIEEPKDTRYMANK